MLFREAQEIGGRSADDSRDPRAVRQTFQRLRMVGLTAAEAGNLTAHLTGLRVAHRAWTVQEIERVLFLRALVEQGRLDP